LIFTPHDEASAKRVRELAAEEHAS
jgi:hypothetical protein